MRVGKEGWANSAPRDTCKGSHHQAAPDCTELICKEARSSAASPRIAAAAVAFASEPRCPSTVCACVEVPGQTNEQTSRQHDSSPVQAQHPTEHGLAAPSEGMSVARKFSTGLRWLPCPGARTHTQPRVPSGVSHFLVIHVGSDVPASQKMQKEKTEKSTEGEAGDPLASRCNCPICKHVVHAGAVRSPPD